MAYSKPFNDSLSFGFMLASFWILLFDFIKGEMYLSIMLFVYVPDYKLCIKPIYKKNN